MLNKISIAAGLMTVIAFSHCSMAQASDITDEINRTNAMAGEIENYVKQTQPPATITNDVTNELNKANALAGEVEKYLQQPQANNNYSSEAAKEIKKTKELVTETSEFLKTQPSAMSSGEFVKSIVHKSNQVVDEVNRSNDQLMKQARQPHTSTAGNIVGEEQRFSHDSSVSSQTPSTSSSGSNAILIPIGAGIIVAIGGVSLLIKP
jgi:archaellum component FlaC